MEWIGNINAAISIFISFMLIFMKSYYFGIEIRDDLTNKFGKKYFKKNKPDNLIKRYFYIGFREKINPFYYWGNILLPLFAVINFIMCITNIFINVLFFYRIIFLISICLLAISYFASMLRALGIGFEERKTFGEKFLYLGAIIAAIGYIIYKKTHL